jgi:citrate synthase
MASHLVAEYAAEGRRLPGFGHPLHRPTDPRAQRLLRMAETDGAADEAVAFARALDAAVQAGPRPLPMNVSLAIAAVMLDLGFPLAVLKGIPLLARTASLVAHLAEEAARPIGFSLADGGTQSIVFDGADLP